MKKSLAIAIFIITSFFSVLSAQQVNGEILSDSSNICVVKVWGTHYERGYAYGYLCGNKIYSVYSHYIVPNFGTLLPLAKAIIGNENNFSIDSIYKSEADAMLDGMADAGIDTTGLDRLDIFVVNFMTDLLGFYSFKEMTQNCSSLMDWGDATLGTDLDGKSVIAHHLDASPLNNYITANQVVVIHLPSEADEQPWMLTGTAGQMTASQALNIEGLVAFLNTVDGFTGQGSMGYEPVTLAIRKGLEKIDYNNDGLNNVNDIRDALSSNTNGYAAGFIISALAPSTAGEDSLIAMVAELAPQQPYITFRYNNYNDNIEGDNLYSANDMVKRNDAQIYCSRYTNVSNEINNNYNGVNIGISDNWNIMRTKSIQSINLQFIQVIPEDCVFKMAVSHTGSPAYMFEPQEFNFCQLFWPSSVPKTNIDDKNIRLYPNPTSGLVNIEGSNILNIEILDISGQVILTATSKETIDLTEQPDGLYFIKITTDKESYTRKLIKE